MNIFVVIVIYNGLRNNWIKKCFDSVLNSSIPVQIIAVDNSSSDDSVNFILHNYPQVHIIRNTINLGFGCANNLGIEYGLKKNGDYFFLLNQDAYVEDDTIELLIKYLNENKEYGILSPLHLNGTGDKLDFNFSNYIVPNECCNLYSDFVLNKVEKKIYPSKFVCAAAWLISKECIEKVGGFNPSFFHYGEDDNYIDRLFYKKLKIGILPFVKIFHDRENRDVNSYQSQDSIKIRKLLLKYSNPNYKIDILTDLKQNKKLYIKYKFMLRFKLAKFYKSEYHLLKKLGKDIKLNKEKSITEKFAFLNFE